MPSTLNKMKSLIPALVLMAIFIQNGLGEETDIPNSLSKQHPDAINWNSRRIQTKGHTIAARAVVLETNGIFDSKYEGEVAVEASEHVKSVPINEDRGVKWQ